MYKPEFQACSSSEDSSLSFCVSTHQLRKIFLLVHDGDPQFLSVNTIKITTVSGEKKESANLSQVKPEKPSFLVPSHVTSSHNVA